MLSSVGQSNNVQRFSAVSAFRSNQNVRRPEEEQQIEVSKGVETKEAKTLLDRIDINELRECAKTVGEFNISDDDIKYGLLYGRSVIAEFLC